MKAILIFLVGVFLLLGCSEDARQYCFGDTDAGTDSDGGDTGSDSFDFDGSDVDTDTSDTAGDSGGEDTDGSTDSDTESSTDDSDVDSDSSVDTGSDILDTGSDVVDTESDTGVDTGIDTGEDTEPPHTEETRCLGQPGLYGCFGPTALPDGETCESMEPPLGTVRITVPDLWCQYDEHVCCLLVYLEDTDVDTDTDTGIDTDTGEDACPWACSATIQLGCEVRGWIFHDEYSCSEGDRVCCEPTDDGPEFCPWGCSGGMPSACGGFGDEQLYPEYYCFPDSFCCGPIE